MIPLLAWLAACAPVAPPEAGLRLLPEQLGQPASAYPGFPAVSLDGSRLVVAEVVDGVGPNLTIREHETRRGEVLREWRIQVPGEHLPTDSPELTRRLDAALLDLSTQMWLPMFPMKPEGREAGRFGGQGVAVAFDGERLTVVRDGSQVYGARPPWATGGSGVFCDAGPGSCACVSRPKVSHAWTSVDRGELLLVVDYPGDGTCRPAPPRYHIRQLPTATELSSAEDQ